MAIFPTRAIDPLLILLLALLLDAIVGDPRFLPHPVVGIGKLIDALEKKLNRINRSQRDRAFRGFILLLIMLSFALTIGLLVHLLSSLWAYGWLVEMLFTAMLLAQRSLFNAVWAVGKSLKEPGLAQAREAVSHLVGRDVSRLDEHGVARAAIESCAENFSDGIVAPVFWYVIFGFPGLLVYKTVNTLDSMIGHKTERFLAFGVTSAKLDDIMNFVPARLAGVYLVMAGLFVPTAKPLRAAKVMLRDCRKHRSPNAGWPEAAMAGSLGVALSGPRSYGDGIIAEPWLGEEFSARVQMQDIKRALYMFVVACLINAMLVAAIWVIRLQYYG